MAIEARVYQPTSPESYVHPVPSLTLVPYEGEPVYEQMPLPGLGLPAERGPIQRRHKNTGMHEFTHGFVGYEEGLTVLYMSTVREGDSLGRTAFAGHLDSERLKTTATASTIQMPGYEPMGFWSDLHTAHHIHATEGGHSVDEATDRAKAKLSKLLEPPELLERCGEIVAHMKYVKGSQIPAIVERARWELEMEAAGLLPKVQTVTEDEVQEIPENVVSFEKYKKKKEPEDQTHIDHLTNGDLRIRFISGGVITREEFIRPLRKKNPWEKDEELEDGKIVEIRLKKAS